MADLFQRYGYVGASWSEDLGDSSTTGYIAFFGSTWETGIEVGSYQDSTYATDSGAATEGNEINNVKYSNAVGATKYVSLNGASAVALNTTNVAQNDTTIKWVYTNDSYPGGTALTNVKFFAYNGTDPSVAPTNIKVMAFERRSSSINYTRVDAGDAWDNSGNGINTVTYALDCEDRTGADTYNFYFGVSVSPQAHMSKQNLKLRMSCDVQ